MYTELVWEIHLLSENQIITNICSIVNVETLTAQRQEYFTPFHGNCLWNITVPVNA